MNKWKKTVAVMLAMMSLAGAGMAASEKSPGSPAATPTWPEFMKFQADLRYRFETIDDEAKKNKEGDEYTRYRNRIRARFGLEATCTEQLKLGLELLTGEANPVSANQTLGDGFTKKEIRLDLAYMDYSFFAEQPDALHLVAGKMKNPFIRMTDDLMWDGDLRPEGLALKGRIDKGMFTGFANLGYMWVEERSSTEDDLMLYAAQLAAKGQFTEQVALTIGAAVYAFQNVQGYDVIDWQDKNKSYGNSTVPGTVSGSETNSAWASEFTPVVVYAKLDLRLMGKPLALYVQEMENTDAEDYSRGHLYGVEMGKAKKPGSWKVGYSYSELEKDATLGMFTDSDRWDGGTDGKGHRIYGKYQVLKNMQLAATYFIDKKKISDPSANTDFNRLQLDVSVKF